MGASAQDIFRGDVSCQTHFFPGGWGGGAGGGEAPLGGGPFGGVGGGEGLHLVGPPCMCPVCPALIPALADGADFTSRQHLIT